MSKYIDYKLILTVIAVPIVLVVLFPSPYFDTSIDYEPDYFANILSVLLNNHPVDITHPGLTVTYLSAIFVRIVGFFESQESFILSLRFFFIFLNLTIIYLSMSVLNKNNTEHILLFIAILVLYPAGHYYLDILSPNIIISSFGVLIAILGAKLNNNKISYPLSYGLVLALGVATKLTFILLIIPAIFSMLVGFINGGKGYFKVSFLIVLGSFICSSLILFYPILPMIPLWPLVWPDAMLIIRSIFNLLHEPYMALLYVASLIVILFFILRKVRISLNNSKYEYKYESLYLTLSLMCLSFLVIAPIIDIFRGKSYIEIIHFSGYFLPILGFSVLFFKKDLSIFKLNLTKYYVAIIFLLAISIKSYTNFINYRDSIIVDNKFSENIDRLLEDSNDVVFYPISEFKSKNLFFAWSDYRYGDSKALFSDRRESLPFSIDSKFERVHILNERNFFIPEGYFDDKVTYRYMKYLQKNDFTPNLHKSLLSKHLHRLETKDVCKRPYDSFSSGRDFIVIIPKNFALMNSNATENFSNSEINLSDKLMNLWVNKCNYKVDHSVGYFADIKSIFLKVTTEGDELKKKKG